MSSSDTHEVGRQMLQKQYELLRAEIIQCIYLRYLVVVAMYAAVAGAAATLTGNGKLVMHLASSGALPFIGIGLAFFVNCFGALYVHEQDRNRRACVLNRAIERELVRSGGGKGEPSPMDGFVWESFLLSDVVRRANFGFHVARYFGVGLPMIVFSMPVMVMCFLFAKPFTESSEWSHTMMWTAIPSLCAVIVLFAGSVVSAWRVQNRARNMGSNANQIESDTQSTRDGAKAGSDAEHNSGGADHRDEKDKHGRWTALWKCGLFVVYLFPLAMVGAKAGWGRNVWDSGLEAISQPLFALALGLSLLLAGTSFFLFSAITRWLGASGPNDKDVDAWLKGFLSSARGGETARKNQVRV